MSFPQPPLPHPHFGDRAALSVIARRCMTERGLEPDFSPEAKAESAAITQPATTADARDLRALLWCSIDNDDSRDLDQLSVAEELPAGRVRILVAVADVDALVHKGMALDKHAATNTTSIYTPAIIFPMLPVHLSTDLTSLNQDSDRAAIVVDMIFDQAGALAESDIYRALVRNKAKLAYSSVGAWLQGGAPVPMPITKVPGLDANLHVQDRVAQQLAALRQKAGALSLESMEARAQFDGDTLSSLDPDGKNRATQLIEDLMVAANGVTATWLQKRGLPSLRRVLKSPERWARIVDLAKGLGGQLPPEPDSGALEAFLLRRQTADPERFPDLSLAVIKLIGRGEYDVLPPGGVPPGHFGLAVRDYTHSTAPNRRFPDLLTQRLLKAALANTPSQYSLAELQELAGRCTEREDAAAKVERQMRKSAAALLLSKRIGQIYDGIVTGAAAKGTWVRIQHPAVEGRLLRGDQGVKVGDKIRVKLLHTDFEKGFIDFAKV
jgi:VacB/RNase II family 3'-5' exoribonuclease